MHSSYGEFPEFYMSGHSTAAETRDIALSLQHFHTDRRALAIEMMNPDTPDAATR
jgi:hypothetical protein